MFYITFIMGIFFSFKFKDKLKATKIYTCVLVLLAAFRYGIGSDYFAYMFLYKKLYTNVISEIRYGTQKQEVGFRALGSLIKSTGADYQIYLAVLAIITLFFLYKISVEFSINPMLSMVTYYSFYYLVWTYSGLRQGLAMAIGMYFLLKALGGEENTQYSFYLVSLILFFVHYSSLVLLVMYFAAKYIKWNKKTIVTALFISVMIAFLPTADILFEIRHYSEILNRVSGYVDASLSFNELFSLRIVARVLLIMVGLYYYEDLIDENPKMKFILHLYFISFMLYFMLQFSEITASRISVYGRLLDIIILPNIVFLKSNKINKKIIVSLFIMFLSFYFLKELDTMKLQAGLITKEEYYISYSSIFNKNDRYYNTQYYYVLFYGATDGFPKNFHMIQ